VGVCGAPSREEEEPMSYETLLYEQEGHVATLTYNRPHQHNAISQHTLGAAAFKAGNLKPDWPNHGL
jgi:1,4-dihydroxy-2-naphthoyl-CoA synthase